MKKIILLLTLGLLSAGINSFGQNMPECLAIVEMELDPAINEVAIENAYKNVHDGMQDEFNGMDFLLLKGIRGERPGKYTLAMCFDLVEFRNYYYPTEGDDLSKSGMDKWRNTGLVQGMPYLRESKLHTDYILMGFDQLVNPKRGEVIAIRYPEIKAGMDREFERRLRDEWLQDLHKGMKGLSIYWLKGDRGERNGKYLMMLVFDTYERYRNYWTAEGQSTEAYHEVVDPYLNMLETMSAYFEEEAFNSYTDYIALDW